MSYASLHPQFVQYSTDGLGRDTYIGYNNESDSTTISIDIIVPNDSMSSILIKGKNILLEDIKSFIT